MLFAEPQDLALLLDEDYPSPADRRYHRYEQALQLASGTIQAVCGWSIGRTSSTTTVATLPVYLPTRMLLSVDAITASGTALLPSAVRFTVQGLVQWAARSLAQGPLTISYTHGYAHTPPAVKAVCLEVAAAAVRNVPGRSSYAVGGVSETFASASGFDLRGDARLTPYTLTGIA